jgi:hypothetical protein
MDKETDSVMDEFQKIKEECSLRYLSQTPEERRREAKEAREWFEAWLGRPIKTVDHTGRGRMRDEPTRV